MINKLFLTLTPLSLNSFSISKSMGSLFSTFGFGDDDTEKDNEQTNSPPPTKKDSKNETKKDKDSGSKKQVQSNNKDVGKDDDDGGGDEDIDDDEDIKPSGNSAVPKTEDELKKEQEAKEAIERIAAEEAALKAAAEEAARIKAEEEARIKAEQEAKAAEELKKMEELKKKEEEARIAAEKAKAEEEARKAAEAKRLLTYQQASQLVVAILYNYQFGAVEDTNDTYQTIWEKNVNSVVNTCINLDTYKLLLTIPYFVQLLYPIGSGDDVFHKYVLLNAKGDIDMDKFKETMNKELPNYVAKKLPQYIKNVIQANCVSYLSTKIKDDMTPIEDKLVKDAFAPYYDALNTCTTDTEWTKRTIQMLNFDVNIIHRAKMLWAKSGKGICGTQIRLVPATYPHNSPKYELLYTLVCLTNTIFNHYGVLQRNTNSTRYAIGDNDLNEVLAKSNMGGQCFAIDHQLLEQLDSFVKLNEILPNYTFGDYVDINERLNQSEPRLENPNDPAGCKVLEDGSQMCSSYPIYFKAATETQKYGQNADGTGGFYKFKNPTQFMTATFINDLDDVSIALPMARMSAHYTGTTIISTLYHNLTTEKHNEIFLTSKSINGDLFNAPMLLSYIPPTMSMGDDFTTPIARFMYDGMITNSCNWSVSIGLDSTMSTSKINSAIQQHKNGFCPQMLVLRLAVVSKINKAVANNKSSTFTVTTYCMNNFTI